MNQFTYATRGYDIHRYDLVWPDRFLHLAAAIKGIWGLDAVDIQHVGSTAVPGMDGKPVLDVLVLVGSPDKLDCHKEAMEAAGYIYQGSVVTDDSRLYREVRDGEIVANMHIFPHDHAHASEMIMIRDYLRSHPEDVEEYSTLKKYLKEKYPNDYASYRREKDAFMDGILKKRAGV
jgi:GrpB-like predicted nucleotidyltransferase (UPF0157 family)